MPEKFNLSGDIQKQPEENLAKLVYGQFLSEIEALDPGFSKLFGIFDQAYEEKIDLIRTLEYLLWYDECPDKYIFRIAEILGFPLLDSPYATEKERRNFLKYAVWIWKRKGTIAGLRKILSILGYYLAEFEESVQEDFTLNFHKVYGLDQRTYEMTSDDFNDGIADEWDVQNDSTWEVRSNKYVGLGNGSDSLANASIISNSYKRFYFQTDFQVLGGSGTYHPYFGAYLSYNGPWRNLGIFLYSDGGADYLKISAWYDAFEVISETYDITGKVSYKTGVHKIKIHYCENKISVGIDDTTLIIPYTAEYVEQFWPFFFKGLFVNESTEVAFDNVEIRRLSTMGVPVLPGGNSQKILKIKLYLTPPNDSAKREYLADVVPKYFLPTGIQVVWE
jgi:hypothetical protein